MKIFIIDNLAQITVNIQSADVELICFSDEIQALNALDQKPELILLHYAVRDKLSPDYIRLLLADSQASSLIVIGENVDEDNIFLCLLAGAKGYQELQQLPHYCDKLVRVVTQGEAWISRKMVARLLEAILTANASLNESVAV